MTSEGLGEMFEGDSGDTWAGKIPLKSMVGRAEGLACADPGARTPIDNSGNFNFLFLLWRFTSVAFSIADYLHVFRAFIKVFLK